MRLALDRTARRLGGGAVLVAGSPLTVFRLGPAGQRVLDAIARGEDLPATALPLVDRLLDTGAAHPRPSGGRFTEDDVTVVMPVFGHDPSEALAALSPLRHVVVVDDASDPPVDGRGRLVLHHHVNQGPAAARTSGVATVRTALVAFVDADCQPAPGWLAPLLAHFDDDRVALAAPRILGTAQGGLLARYDAVRGPLDLGPAEGRIAPGTRVPYVPAAALLVRVDALRAVGGFDPAMRVGEDVDLVWRLVEQGWRARYEPRSVVAHRPRSSLRAFAGQRFAYGRSAAALDQRHPGAVAPAMVSPWAAGAWSLAALGHPWAGAAVGLAPAVGLRRTLPAMAGRDALAARLAALGLVRAGEQLASAVTRVWWPPALLAALAVRRLRAPLLAAAVVPGLVDWARRPSGIDPLRYLGLRLLDDAAYGAGVWAGAWAAREAGALSPRRRPARPAAASRPSAPPVCLDQGPTG